MRRAVTTLIAGAVSFFIGAALVILNRSFWGPLVVSLTVYVFLTFALTYAIGSRWRL